MKGLTIKQPFASAILFGGKDIENRSWEPPRALIGERIFIHAAKSTHPLAESVQELWPHDLSELPRGQIIGTARIERVWSGDLTGICMPALKWWLGPIGWRLVNPEPLETPITVRGRLGLWEYDLGLEEESYMVMHDHPWENYGWSAIKATSADQAARRFAKGLLEAMEQCTEPDFEIWVRKPGQTDAKCFVVSFEWAEPESAVGRGSSREAQAEDVNNDEALIKALEASQ